MRKLLYSPVCLFLISCLAGCKKSFLEQTNPNSVSVERGFQSETDIANGVYGVYQALRSSNCIGEGASTWTDDRSDDVNSTDNQSSNGEPFQFTAFSLVPSNTFLQSHWTALYAPIARANTILSVINNVSFANENTKAQYIGELKFIRALMYFNLVSEFGGVPLVTERLTSTEQVSALTKRETLENVYAQIVADLKDALNSKLPVTQPSSGKGRVSQQAINGLLGQVYLRMGATLSTANATEHFNNAKTYLLACYNQKTFATLQALPFAGVFDVSQKTTNPEIIFQIPYIQGDVNYSSRLAANNQARGETINSQINSTGAGGTLTLDLQKEFESGDIRSNYSIKYAAAPAVQAYFITKFRDASSVAGTLGYGGNDWIVLRYADIILNLAELHMYLNENTTAIQYLDMVRARAGMPSYTAMQTNTAYTSKYPTLKLAILHERRAELAFEHHRWHDLTRFFSPTELATYLRAKNQADYSNSPLTNVTTKDYYYPIPLNEVKLDPERMHQNPGY